MEPDIEDDIPVPLPRSRRKGQLAASRLRPTPKTDIAPTVATWAIMEPSQSVFIPGYPPTIGAKYRRKLAYRTERYNERWVIRTIYEPVKGIRIWRMG